MYVVCSQRASNSHVRIRNSVNTIASNRPDVLFNMLQKYTASRSFTQYQNIPGTLQQKITWVRENYTTKTLKKTRIKLCNALVLPVLLYGSETWTVKARDTRRITAVEMKYMRRTAGYTWDRLQNKCTNCKGVKNNTNFAQITGIQEKLDTTCK